MKKHVLIVLATILFIGVSAKAVSYSLTAHFLRCLSTCEKFTHDDGRKITVIMGWTNRKCYFKEITHNRTIMCALKPMELAHFTEEIKKGFTPLTPEVVADKTKLFEAVRRNY